MTILIFGSIFIIALIIITINYVNKSEDKNSKGLGLKPVVDKENFKPIALVIDTETTGLIKDNSIRATKNNLIEHDENFPRLVQISFMLIDKLGNYDGQTFYIKQSKKIPKQAIKIHGITDDICEKEGFELKKVLLELDFAVSKVDDLVGHNVRFDYKVLNGEYIRNELPFTLKKKNKIDTMKLTAKFLGRKYGYKISLYNSAEKLFGNQNSWKSLKPQLKAHSSESDAIVTALIYIMLRGKN